MKMYIMFHILKSIVNCYRSKTKVKQQQPLSILLVKLVHNTSASGWILWVFQREKTEYM